MKTDHLPSALQIAASMLTPEQIAEAKEIASQMLKMTPRKFALLLVQHVSPGHIFEYRDEAVLRAIDRKTLSKMKARRELP